MQGGKNWILPKEINANRFFWDSHWLEIWSNHFCPSMRPNRGSVAMDGLSIPIPLEPFLPPILQNLISLFIYSSHAKTFYDYLL